MNIVLVIIGGVVVLYMIIGYFILLTEKNNLGTSKTEYTETCLSCGFAVVSENEVAVRSVMNQHMKLHEGDYKCH